METIGTVSTFWILVLIFYLFRYLFHCSLCSLYNVKFISKLISLWNKKLVFLQYLLSLHWPCIPHLSPNGWSVVFVCKFAWFNVNYPIGVLKQVGTGKGQSNTVLEGEHVSFRRNWKGCIIWACYMLLLTSKLDLTLYILLYLKMINCLCDCFLIMFLYWFLSLIVAPPD